MQDFIIVNDPYKGIHLEHKNGFKYLSKQWINGKWHYIYNSVSNTFKKPSKSGNLRDRGYSSSTEGTNTQNLRDRGYSNSRGISNTYLYEGVYNKNALRKQGYANSRTDGAAGANYWEMVNKKSLRNQGYANSRTDGSAGASYQALVKKSEARKEVNRLVNEGSKLVSNLLQKLKKNELKHHGILGQKWGVRRYQNEDGSLTEAGKKHYGTSKSNISDEDNLSRKGLKRRLNDLDQAKAYNIRDYWESERKLRFIQRKFDKAYENEQKAINAGKNTDKIVAEKNKLESEYWKTAAKYFTSQANIKKGKEEIDKLIEKYGNKFDIRKLDTYREVGSTKNKILAAFFGVHLMERAPGTYYKVKDKKIKENEDEDKYNWITDSNGKSVPLNKTKVNEDANHTMRANENSNKRYNIDFLEAIQNKKILTSGTEKQIDKQYELYKKNPEKYWEEEVKKLEDE